MYIYVYIYVYIYICACVCVCVCVFRIVRFISACKIKEVSFIRNTSNGCGFTIIKKLLIFIGRRRESYCRGSSPLLWCLERK